MQSKAEICILIEESESFNPISHFSHLQLIFSFNELFQKTVWMKRVNSAPAKVEGNFLNTRTHTQVYTQLCISFLCLATHRS